MLEVVALVVFRPRDAAFKAHPLALMEAQAAALDLPLLHVVIAVRQDGDRVGEANEKGGAESDAEGEAVPVASSYKEAYVSGMLRLSTEHGVKVIATGDMDLVGTMQRNWIEECGEEAGIEAFLPLWKADRATCLRQLLDEGFQVVFSCVKSPWFDGNWIGRSLSRETLRVMQEKVQSLDLDLGGERGEYHTMCLDGPLYLWAVQAELDAPRELEAQPGQKEGERWWVMAVHVQS